jgi:Acetyltransferases, including N-acetylases of ribosomal proteins
MLIPTVRLRAPCDTDVEARMIHPPSPEILRIYGYTGKFAGATSRRAAEQWLQQIRESDWGQVIEVDGRLAGQVRLHDLNREDRRARLAIGLVAEAFLGRGIGRAAIALALEQAFGEMGLHRVDLRVLAFNARAIRCYEAAGFRREGVERETVLMDGVWQDDVIMSILEGEYRTCKHADEA